MQQPFIFYVGYVQHIQIIYYNIYTYNLVIKICNTARLGVITHAEFCSPFLRGERLGREQAFSAQTGRGPSVLPKRVVAPVALSQNPQLCIFFFLFSWVCKSSWGVGLEHNKVKAFLGRDDPAS